MITNAHVVWPYSTAKVTFPDGSEHENAPVAHIDLLADIAVLGPLQTSLEPLSFQSGEDMPIGSEFLLIGYPGEVSDQPQPSIVRGLFSRLRQWESAGITYLQTDNPIAGGQSGGALVSMEGDVIGISSYSFTEADYGVSISASDISARVQALIDGGTPGPSDRRVSLEGLENPIKAHNFSMDHFWDTKMYVINEPAGTVVNITADSAENMSFRVVDIYGELAIYMDEGHTGVESGSFTVEFEAPMFLILRRHVWWPGFIELEANVALTRYTDVDDGRRLTRGQTITGAMDFPRDADHYIIDLEEGETIEISMESATIDSYVVVGYFSPSGDGVFDDDDSGGGIFGMDARLSYEAPHSGSFFVAAFDPSWKGIGGYLLTVD